eukprot:6184239-Pleurochrysis_carterae.AAC.2
MEKTLRHGSRQLGTSHPNFGHLTALPVNLARASAVNMLVEILRIHELLTWPMLTRASHWRSSLLRSAIPARKPYYKTTLRLDGERRLLARSVFEGLCRGSIGVRVHVAQQAGTYATWGAHGKHRREEPEHWQRGKVQGRKQRGTGRSNGRE